jgi:hypothetical protein
MSQVPLTLATMLAACLPIFRRGVRTKRELYQGDHFASNSISGYSRNACATVFDVLPKRQNEANGETLIKTMIQDEQDNQEKYKKSYSLIDCK